MSSIIYGMCAQCGDFLDEEFLIANEYAVYCPDCAEYNGTDVQGNEME